VSLIKDNWAIKVWATNPFDNLLQAGLALAGTDQCVVCPAVVGDQAITQPSAPRDTPAIDTRIFRIVHIDHARTACKLT
jgi:hypothetical protein